jgi:hypothetical protein
VDHAARIPLFCRARWLDRILSESDS